MKSSSINIIIDDDKVRARENERRRCAKSSHNKPGSRGYLSIIKVNERERERERRRRERERTLLALLDIASVDCSLSIIRLREIHRFSFDLSRRRVERYAPKSTNNRQETSRQADLQNHRSRQWRCRQSKLSWVLGKKWGQRMRSCDKQIIWQWFVPMRCWWCHCSACSLN